MPTLKKQNVGQIHFQNETSEGFLEHD